MASQSKLSRIDFGWDKRLGIRTVKHERAHADCHHYPYEPTPYRVLERLIENGYIQRGAKVLDYGCGKGRVGFFLHSLCGCSYTGIEYDPEIFHQAEQNAKSYTGKGGVNFLCMNAEDYRPRNEDRIYFFNPFSIKTLEIVLGRIRISCFENPRDILLFFYYPNDEYLSYLMTIDFLCFLDEIHCQDLFEGKNDRERILVFKLTS